MSTHVLRAWTDIVRLHPDVEAGSLTEAVFAIDLGGIAAGDPNIPVVNRDPEAFFRATYLTADLRRLLDEVLASLTGKQGYNRVLKLRTPFGGGKSHTLACLLHAAKNRKAMDVLPEAKGFANPGEVMVAVFDGEKFDACDGKTLPGGQKIQTMWGWLAWQMGEEKYRLVEKHDQDRVSPGGDVIQKLLAGKPKLLLLDEVLKYMERASAVAVQDSTLRRQALDFFHNLTVEVANSSQSVLVYSLQWSAREAMDNVALLGELDKMASRVDQLREPVTGDEILPILQRRLLGEKPSETAAQEVAQAYCDVVTGMQRAYAETESARRQADEDGLVLRDRLRQAYPFHPALIDVMRERWTSVDAFQRTRGALRFLASCLHVLKKNGGAQPLLGPAEVPIDNVEVRVKLLKELGDQRDYDPVILADIAGPNARAKRIDDRIGRETPALASIRPATRLATAILMYSFGGLKRQGTGKDETLPPGVTESELLAACVGPNLDNITAKAVLAELRNSCLYLHYDGVRYCFKKDPNVTKLIEDAEQEVVRNPEEVRGRIRDMLEKRLSSHHGVIIWPQKSQDVPDEEPRFLVGYMPLEFAGATKAEQQSQAVEILSQYGEKPRKYRNGIGLAIPDKKQIESLRRAVRYLLAIERVDEKKKQLRLSKDQLDQLTERRRTEEAAAESAFRMLYASVWLPRMEEGRLGIEPLQVGGRPLQATGVHERVMELLTSVSPPKVHGTVMPRKIAERVKLGESIGAGEPPRYGVKTIDILYSFFGSLEPPRLESDRAVRKGIVKGVTEGTFAYCSGSVPKFGDDGKFLVSWDKIVFKQPLSEDEIDLESGFLIVPSTIPEPQTSETAGGQPPGPTGPSPGPVTPLSPGPTEEGQGPANRTEAKKVVRLRFSATRDQLFKTFPALANLADKSDGNRVTIQIESTASSGYDQSWLRNAVQEPLDEAGLQIDLAS